MKKIAKFILALILIYMILITSIADINHGKGLLGYCVNHKESRFVL